MKATAMHTTPRTTSVTHSFKSLWQWLMAKPGQSLPACTQQAYRLHLVVSPTHAAPVAKAGSPSRPPTVSAQRGIPSRPVRVLQVMDAGQSPVQSGRLRISGRMADVCAELDRLAARESLQH
ncbi:hypothetical protein [Rhodoferax antarcticus]|uniref:hypothetical protein n=2 Tax=Rhodoferax antarcticus TaxID=81479 RepID=UPI000A62E69A|nr:hypothetical protein [Rhodoferax antarcticus]